MLQQEASGHSFVNSRVMVAQKKNRDAKKKRLLRKE